MQSNFQERTLGVLLFGDMKIWFLLAKELTRNSWPKTGVNPYSAYANVVAFLANFQVTEEDATFTSFPSKSFAKIDVQILGYTLHEVVVKCTS